MTAPENAHVDALLLEAAGRATWPATPDLRMAVLTGIAQGALQPGGRAPRIVGARPALRIGRALAFALVALLLVAGIAAALGYRLPGLDILFVDRLPPAGTGLDLGSPITLERALALDRPHVLVPATLPAPEAAFSLESADLTIVTLAYRAAPGQPTLAGSDLALTVMAVPGDTDEGLIRKLVGDGTTLDSIVVGGSRGWWITGAPHEILIARTDGSVEVLRSALAGDTLVFSRDGTLYRLESALGRDATIEIARSMR